jgi:hypothetical protein
LKQEQRRNKIVAERRISRLTGPARKPNCITTEIQNLRKFNLDGFSRKTSDREAYKRNQKEKQWWLSLAYALGWLTN